MINSILKIALVVGVVSLMPIESVNGQLKMTHIPTRLEDALINPDLIGILRNNVQIPPEKASAVAAPRSISLPESPVYLNEAARFSPIEPKLDTLDPAPSRLSTIEQTEQPPRVASRRSDLALSDEVADVPPATRSQSRQPAATNNQRVESDLDGNPDMLKPLAPVKGQLQFRVTGVAAMVEGQSADMLIEVYNPTGHTIGPVEVNVQVPEELTITRFDRDAWLDSERRIIAFQLDRIEPETVEKVAMKGVSNTAGKTTLNVALISGEFIVAERSVKTQVFPEQVARQQNFGDSGPADTNRK